MGSAVILPRGVVAPGDPAPAGVTLDAACAWVRADFARHDWPAGEVVLELHDENGPLCSAGVMGGAKATPDELTFRATAPNGGPGILAGSEITARVVAAFAVETAITLSWG
ncbi:MAG TPA: hypothetical protein PKY87_12495 [Terricaulis sp.]|nr:hypothetical protein [Terricaulis sp.]